MRFALGLLIGIVALPLAAQEKPRVFVTVNPTRRSQKYNDPTYSGSSSSIEDRTVEISDDFSQSCKGVTVNGNRKKADYIARFSWLPARSRVAVYRANGDLIGGAEKVTVASTVKAACDLIEKDQQQAAAKAQSQAAPLDSTK